MLPPQVRASLDMLFATGGGPLMPGDLDDRCVERLGELPPATALTILEVFRGKR
jgi:hypothetical protein